MENKTLLEIKNITVLFNQGTPYEKTVLDDFNLNCYEGDFIVLLGSNGAGKSTLFNAILGNLDYSGDIVLNDKNINKMKTFKRCKQIGVVYQDPLRGTAPNLTVLENVMLASKEKTFFKPNFKHNIIKEFNEEINSYGLNLEKRLTEKAKLLSGGERQALTLYMATMSNPKLLLLDEHTAALDPNTQERIMEITNNIINKKKVTTLMITHNLDTALKYGNRLIILNQGKIVVDLCNQEKMNTTKEKLLEMYSKHFSDNILFK